MSVDTATVRRIAHLARIAVEGRRGRAPQGRAQRHAGVRRAALRGECRGRRADDLGDADGDEEARGRGDRRRHRGRHREECAGDARTTFSSCRRWWSSHVLGLPGRRSRAHLGAGRHHLQRPDAGRAHGGGPARDGPAAAGRTLSRGAAGRHDPDPAAVAPSETRRRRTPRDRKTISVCDSLRQNDRPDFADARRGARSAARKRHHRA